MTITNLTSSANPSPFIGYNDWSRIQLAEKDLFVLNPEIFKCDTIHDLIEMPALKEVKYFAKGPSFSLYAKTYIVKQAYIGSNIKEANESILQLLQFSSDLVIYQIAQKYTSDPTINLDIPNGIGIYIRYVNLW